ncbi:MAG TPA: ABC transporter substrate-binding protein, partial [Actinomycetospora sp.]|uniref:ABC transporter substrate-binding protein n=1 Tax=Actinomycetospora sp. TaxID=1872135 RepID=UPI002F424476
MLRPALPAVLALVGVVLVGCASPLDDLDAGVPRQDVTSAVVPDATAAALVPPAVAQAGVLTVGASVGGQPSAFRLSDGVTVVGQDIDMTEAVARTLALRVERTEGTFDGIVPGLTSGKFDVATGNFAVTEARKKVVSFVTYINDGQGFAVRADDPQPPIHDLADLCGRTVSVLAGSTFEASLAKAQPRCPTAGRPPIDARSYPDGATASLALAQRRADVTMSTINGLRYLVSQQPRLRFVNEYRRLDVGFALAKDSPLVPAVHAAVERLMADGTYARILAKWGTPTS